MGRTKKLDKIEKLVLLCGVLLILLIGGIGVLKGFTSKPEGYVSNETADETTAREEEDEEKGVSLKKDRFTMKVNGALDQDASGYFEGSVAELKKVEMDFSGVNTNAVGTYTVKAAYKDRDFDFSLEVEQSENPIMGAYQTSFKYLIGAYSSMDEVRSLAGVTALDKDGRDISADVIGWPKELPSENGKKTYRLQATDVYGNTGYIDITVDFQLVVG